MTLGHQVQVGYFRQEVEAIPAESTVFEALLDVRNLPLEEARGYLARFQFRGEEVFQSVSSLSGGQRSRLALARLLINEPNLLILDEPSTHLDIATREALEQVLLDFPELVVVGGHIGFPWLDEVISLARKYPNFYIDTSAYTAKRYPTELVEYGISRRTTADTTRSTRNAANWAFRSARR